MNSQPILGVVSDTEAGSCFAEAVAREFTSRDCTHVFHCGDIGPPMNLELLACPGRQLLWLPGDGDFVDLEINPAIQQTSKNIGALCVAERLERRNGAGRFQIGGRRLAASHNPYGGNGVGMKNGLVRTWSQDKSLDLIVYGHFHYFNVRSPGRSGAPVILCPGGHQRSVAVSTCAIVRFLEGTILIDLYWYHRSSSALKHVFSIDTVEQRAIRANGWSFEFVEEVRTAYEHPKRTYWCENWKLALDPHGWFPIDERFFDDAIWESRRAGARTIAGAFDEQPRQP